MTERILLTPEEAAARIHVCARTLRKLRQEGRIRYVAITERIIRYRPEDCDDFLDRCIRREQPAPPPKNSPGRRTGNPAAGLTGLGFMARREAMKNGSPSGASAKSRQKPAGKPE